MSNQICLKWNSFLNNIATSFESLWEEEGLVDVTLASDGQCLTAHKVILSASSPFFKKVFQTNPCQHPVVILQDVHFSELEALLIFIYKGEVNIEQKNLPALLKAAETLQIRGLSGGDIFAKDSYKRLNELAHMAEEETTTSKDETPWKKQKLNKHPHSILETALAPNVSQADVADESITSEQSSKEGEYSFQKHLPNPVYHHLEMKIEPLEMSLDDSFKHCAMEKDPEGRLGTGQIESTPEIFGKYPEDKPYKPGGRSVDDNPFRLIARHFPSKHTNPAGMRQNARRKCVVCSKHKKRRETHFQCIECNVGLCIAPCFELYHTQHDY